MKLFGSWVGWFAGGVVAGGMTALAAAEQWLDYHTTSEGRGYRWLELSTNAPPGVPLPKLGASPCFVRWTTPLDPQGARWICFDRARHYGPYNRVFLDSNGDGRLDDETPQDAVAMDDYSATFAPARVVFKGEDGPLTYHLNLRFMRYTEDDMRVLASSGCYYDGKVNLGGKKRLLTLEDSDVNGTFNDHAPDPADCDHVIVEGDKAGYRLLGQMLEVGDELFTIEVARDGAFVKLEPAQNVTLGQVRVPETVSEFVAFGAPGHFVRRPANGVFTLPVGTYRVHGWTIDRKDDKGAAWKISGSSFNDFSSFAVAVDKPAALDVGEPVLAALTATENKGGADFSLRLKGRLGESVEILKGPERPRAPRLQLASASGPFRATNTFEYG